jgi:hypothetical protein
MSTINAHRNANGLLEDLVSKDCIDIVYKKAKHTLNVCFRALVWASSQNKRIKNFFAKFNLQKYDFYLFYAIL